MEHLPIDLIREHILPFTYRPQSSALCEDIRGFHALKYELFDVYKKEFPNDIEYLEWISNDLDRFMNNDIPLMYGYEDEHLDYYLRFFMLQNRPRAAAMVFLHNLHDYPLSRDINMRLALLTPAEREQFKGFIVEHTDVPYEPV